MSVAGQQTIEFDLHGIIRVRLVDPGESDVAGLAELLGTPQSTRVRAPDIIIRYCEEFPRSRVRFLGLNFAAFTNDDFYVLGWKDGQIRARIAFETIGDCCEISCRRNLGFVPLLTDIIHLLLIGKGYIPIHASAFAIEDTGIVAMGWTKGGKTETLLSFLNHDARARYVGDEWVVLADDGQSMFGLPLPVTIWDRQLEQIPGLVRGISARKKVLFKAIHLLESVERRFGGDGTRRLAPMQFLSDALPSLKRQLKIAERPQVLFEQRQNAQPVAPDKIFLMVSHMEPDIRVEPTDPVEIARRMQYSNECEQLYLFEHYKAFKFAFPHLRSDFLERVDGLQTELLCSALRGKEAYTVYHPYPISFEQLFKHLEPYCSGRT